MDDNRQKLIDDFLDSCQLTDMTIKPLAQDASFRRYFRIYTDTATFILMDAPPEYEDVNPFILVAKHLLTLKLRAPTLIKCDLDNGFILLEDFGDNTFTRLLNQGYNQQELYQIAANCLIDLQQHSEAKKVAVPPYSNELFVNEALLLVDWYYPKQMGKPLGTEARSDYVDLWHCIFDQLPTLADTLVLRDFHVDNLIKLDSGDCGLLDFQDAVIGSPAYDLVSLLEDARRDIPEALQTEMLNHYLAAMNFEKETFMRWYRVLGAQRHCKVLGIFTRLSIRDGKHHYLQHLPRVEKLLINHLSQADLKPLKNWLEKVKILQG